MVRPVTKQLLGVLGILREALAVPLRNGVLMASVLLVLLPFNVLFTFPELTPQLQVNFSLFFIPSANPLPAQREPSNGEPTGVAESAVPPAGIPISMSPVNIVAQRLSMLAMVYLSAVACRGKHSTLRGLLSKFKRSWKKVAVSFIYFQLFGFTHVIFFIMLVPLRHIFGLSTLVLFLVLLALFSALCFAFVVLLYLDLACVLSLVISAVEEDKCGLAALAKAVSLTRGRRLQGLVLTALCYELNGFTAADYADMRSQKLTEITAFVAVCRFSGVLVDLSARLFVWLLWTAYYYECRKSHELRGEGDRVDEGQSLLPMLRVVSPE